MQNNDELGVTSQPSNNKKRDSNLRFTGTVGFATPGLNTNKEGYPVSAKKLNSKVQDRYAPVSKAEDLNSDIAEENMKQYLINSPLSKQTEEQKGQVSLLEKVLNTDSSTKNQTQGNEILINEKGDMGTVPITSPKFGLKKGEKPPSAADGEQKEVQRNMKPPMSKISQEDIINRKTVEEVLGEDIDGGMESKMQDLISPMPHDRGDRGFNSSGLSSAMQNQGSAPPMTKKNLEISISPFVAKQNQESNMNSNTIKADMAKEVLIVNKKSPSTKKTSPQNGEAQLPDALEAETHRLERLENMKEYVKFKKVMDYESETIELYEMISELFDYDLLRKESANFNVKQYKDSIYRGEINEKRKREGKGVIVYETGRIYEGEWSHDKRHGRGYELFSNGNTYQGDYLKGKAEGKGAYIWRNGEVYDGEWQTGQKQGYGVWKGIHGDSYIGQWFNSKAEGYGVHTWLDGDRYEGEWQKCLRHGNGTDFFANHDVYTGQYRDGRPEGYGQYKWANGNQYTGEFKEGQKHGKGKWKKQPSDLSQKNRFNQYDGYYEMDKKHGYGVFQWESGNKYQGNYHYDERQGYGTMEWTDMSKFKGHWIKGVQQGIGIMIFPNGIKRAGFFNNNIYSLPLKSRAQIKDIENEMPEEILDELLDYLNQRDKKIDKMKDDGLDVESQMLESEQDFMGQEFKPKVEYEEPSEDEDIAKMNQVKGMNDIGKQINENQSNEPFINHEGLKRVYKTKEEREASALKEQAAKEQAARERNITPTAVDRLEDIWPSPNTVQTVPSQLQNKSNRQSPKTNQNPFHQQDPRSNLGKEIDVQTSLNMEKINKYNFDDLNNPNKFKKRKQSRHMETQTNLQMDTINKYEALTQGNNSQNNQYYEHKDKNNSSSNNHTQNHTRADQTAPYTNNNPEQQISEFGHINDSQEFNKKQNLNNLDKSITSTDIVHKKELAQNTRNRQNQITMREKYTSDIDINIDVQEINKSFNESDKILKETVGKNKTKMIQTIQATKKENRNKFLLQNQDDITSFDGSDVQPAPQSKKNKTDQRPAKQQINDNNILSPSVDQSNSHLNLPKTTTNKQYQEKPTTKKMRSSSSWFVEQEEAKKKVVISQSSQLPSEEEQMKAMRNQNRQKQLEKGARNQFSINSKTDDEEQGEDDQLESILPSIQGRSRMSNNNTGVFNKRFEQAQAANKKIKRNKFMVSQNMSEDINDETIGTPDGQALKFHEFELLPRMRETYHLGARPNPEGLYDVQKRINNYQSDGQNGPFHSNIQGRNSDSDSIEGSRAKLLYPQMLQTLQAPANHNTIQQSQNMSIQDPLQHSVIIKENQNDSLMQNSHQYLNQSYQIPPLPNLKKKKKGKKGKSIGRNVAKGRGLVFNTNTRGSPIRIGGEKSARRGSSVKNHVTLQSKLPVSGLRIAPMNYLSQVGNSNLHSTSNKMASIYKQPIVGGFKKKKSEGSNQISQLNPNFQSMTTSHQTNPVYNFQMQSLNQNNYNQLAGSDSQNFDYTSPNPDMIDHLKKRKVTQFLNGPMNNQNSHPPSDGQRSQRSNTRVSPLPQIRQTPLNNLKYHQNNNSIQAIDFQNQNGEELNMNINSNTSLKNSPSNDQTGGKKKRKRVWIPASSLRRVGLNAPALIQ